MSPNTFSQGGRALVLKVLLTDTIQGKQHQTFKILYFVPAFCLVSSDQLTFKTALSALTNGSVFFSVFLLPTLTGALNSLETWAYENAIYGDVCANSA